MLTRTFPQLLPAGRLEAHTRMVDSWRFCVDTPLGEGREGGALYDATLGLFAAIIDGRSRLATARLSPLLTCASSAS